MIYNVFGGTLNLTQSNPAPTSFAQSDVLDNTVHCAV